MRLRFFSLVVGACGGVLGWGDFGVDLGVWCALQRRKFLSFWVFGFLWRV
jgi:hypothetical protein